MSLIKCCWPLCSIYDLNIPSPEANPDTQYEEPTRSILILHKQCTTHFLASPSHWQTWFTSICETKQNGWLFADENVNSNFFNKYSGVFNKTGLKCVPKVWLTMKASLFWAIAWCPTGAKPLPEPMMTQCCDTDMHQQNSRSSSWNADLHNGIWYNANFLEVCTH